MRHVRRKFISILSIQLAEKVFTLVTKSAGNFRGLEPRLIITGDGGESEIVEAKKSGHDASVGTFQGSQGIFHNRKCRVLKTANGAAPRLWAEALDISGTPGINGCNYSPKHSQENS
ncbi:hypothetical protein [uncultured Bilophila sp.]|uniref:hypothetical protein n=1 Tax=uncultured Bilophila sp. TaxID=529385 RepID=UPI002595AB68|nr:hypothetical protein [uncultured Bilophila sp.]